MHFALAQQRVDLAALDQGVGPLELVVDDRVGRDAEQVIDGGDQVGGIVRVAGRIGGDRVGGAEADAAGDPAAGHHQRIGPRPVVAAGAAVDPRGPAELGVDPDQRSSPASRDGRGRSPARRRRVSRVGHRLSFIAVKWRPCVSQPGGLPAVVDVDHGHAGLGQAAGQQARLADRVPAVGVADRGRLGREVEGAGDRRER